jgi:hypothetical protein
MVIDLRQVPKGIYIIDEYALTSTLPSLILCSSTSPSPIPENIQMIPITNRIVIHKVMNKLVRIISSDNIP